MNIFDLVVDRQIKKKLHSEQELNECLVRLRQQLNIVKKPKQQIKLLLWIAKVESELYEVRTHKLVA